jgi:hypothetical protein
LVITQNGEAKAVLQGVASFEETQETLALLKVLGSIHDYISEFAARICNQCLLVACSAHEPQTPLQY